MVDLRARRVGSFWGRSAEIEEIWTALDRHRVVTLIGPGGAGKTRLALESIDRLERHYLDGSATIDLSSIVDPTLVPSSIARGTDSFDASAERHGADSMVNHICGELSDRQMLILLDNCEHLLDAVVEIIGQVLTACHDVRFLATSRAPLGLADERCVAVGPLSEGAAEFFTERASAAGASIDPLRDGRTIEAICARVDHLPLAIELAASRSRQLPLQELERRLDDALVLLRRTDHAGADRQSTMEATIAWSHDRLSAAGRQLFRRLGVFAGGCTVEAVEAICSGPPHDGDTVVGLGELVDASMIMVDHGANRYSLLEPIRQYAWQRLDESGEQDTLIEAHRAYFAAQAGALNRRVLNTGITDADRAELENQRVAIIRAFERGRHAAALTSIVNLGWFWVGIGAQRERIELIERGLTGADELGHRLELVATSMAAGYLAYAGLAHRAERHLERSLALLETAESAPAARYLLSTALECLGRPMQDMLRAAEDEALASDDVELAAYVIRAHARWLTLQWRLDEAEVMLGRSMSLTSRDSLFSSWVQTQHLAIRALRGDALDPSAIERIPRRTPTGAGMSGELEDRSITLALSDEPVASVPVVAATARQFSRSGMMQRALIQVHLAGVVRARLGQSDLAIRLTAGADVWWAECGYAPLELFRHLGRAELDAAAARLGPSATEHAATTAALVGFNDLIELCASPVPALRAGPLSAREAQVIALVAEALDNHQIAAQLHISRRTVDAHLAHIRTKLGITSRTALVRWAIERDLGPVRASTASTPP